MINLNRIFITILSIIFSFGVGFLYGKHNQATSDESKAREQIIINQQRVNDKQLMQINLIESSTQSLESELNIYKERYNDANRIIQRYQTDINAHNYISVEWVRFLNSAYKSMSEVSTTSSGVSGNESIPAYEVLTYVRGLKEHDDTCVVTYNKLKDYVNQLIMEFNK